MYKQYSEGNDQTSRQITCEKPKHISSLKKKIEFPPEKAKVELALAQTVSKP